MPDFQEPREVVPLPHGVVVQLASRQHRLVHAVWHGVRDLWRSKGLDSENDSRRAAIDALHWKPPRHALEWVGGARRPAVHNGSGEDFLFMHREMIAFFDAEMIRAGANPDVGWRNVPEPGASNSPGNAVPPAWDLAPVPNLQRRFAALKSDEFFWSRMRWWERDFMNPVALAQMTLGELGSLLETSIHNDMHMRWAAQPRDPETGELTLLGREEFDIDPKWDAATYDFLGETYSSHVNPVFWRLHKWVDARIDDWYAAHEMSHPGEVRTRTLNGVTWFEPGRFVKAAAPWSGPLASAAHVNHHGSHGHADHHSIYRYEIPEMERVMDLLFPKPIEAAKAIWTKSALPIGREPRLRNWF